MEACKCGGRSWYWDAQAGAWACRICGRRVYDPDIRPTDQTGPTAWWTRHGFPPGLDANTRLTPRVFSDYDYEEGG